MVFDGLAQRRLASLLRPWLRQEPDLELKLGLLRSSGVAKNLNFDPAALNQQLFEQSDRWSVKDITVEQLSLRVSYWSVPTFTIEVQGVHVTLLGALDETRRLNDGGLQDRNKLIAEIDPEGAALHEVMQKLSLTDPQNSRKTSFLNVFLKRCQLKMQDIHLHVQFPVRNDYIGCFCEIKELCTESLLTEHGCFLRGLLSFPFAPLKESVFSIQVLGFEIGVKRKDHITCLMRPTDMLTRINLKDLQISDSSLNVPEITFSLSLEALPIILAVCMLSFEKSRAGRSGRCLWNIAASRISSLVSNPRLSLHRSVNIVLLWLRYVKNYEDLLSLVGYPLDNSVEQSVARMSENGTFSVLVKNQWRIVSEIENELPSKAVARGRRIARHRALVSGQQQRDNSKKLYLFGQSTFFRRFAILVELVWVIICKSVNSWLNLLLQVFSGKCEQLDRQCGTVPEDSCAWSCFGLNIGKISVISSPVNKVGAFVDGTRTSEVNNSSLDLHGFGVSFHEFFLTSRVSICEQYLLISLGQIKVMSLPSTEDISKETSDYLEGHLRKKVHESKTILFSDPAEMFHIHEDSENAAPDGPGGTPISFLWDALGEMSSNWNFFRTKFEPTETQYSEGPWLLCEIKKHVMGQDFEDLNRGFCKFSSTVGKLNFLLDYSSLFSVVVFVKQIQHALVWTQNSRKASVLLPTQVTSEIPPFISWEALCDSYVTEIKKKIIEVLPQQHIQIAVFVAGPSIQMTLQEGYIGDYKNGSRSAMQDDFHLTLAVRDIELAVWPTLRSDYVSPSVCQGLGGASPVCLGLIGSQEVYNTNGETYSSQGNTSLGAYLKLNGLEAYLDDSSSNQQHGILVLHPSTVKLLALWKDEHSFFGADLITLSASFQGMSAGFSVLFCMDEWFIPAKILADLFSKTSCNASLFDSYSDFGFQGLMNRDGVHVEHEREPTKETVKELLSLNLMNTLFVVDVKFELKSTDLVLQNFRKCNKGKKHIMNFGAVRSKRLPMHDIPDDGISISVQMVKLEFSCGEEVAEVTANVSELRCCIFRDKKEIFEVTDGLRRSNFLNSMSCLYEISLSHCAFALSVALPVNNFSSGSGNDAFEHCTSIAHMVADSSTAVEDNVSDTSYHLDQKFGLAPNGAVLASSHWLSLNFEISEIYTCGFPAKQRLAGAESLSKLVSSLLIGRGIQTIAVQTQGGSIILEPSAVVRFVDCFASYLHCIRSLVHTVLSSVNMVSGTREKMVVQDVNPREEIFKAAQHIILEHLEACTVEFSQFSLSLVASDESGTLKQLQFEADFHSTFELGSLSRKISLDLSRFSILSKINHEVLEKKIDIQSPHFASFKSSGSSPHSLSEDAAEVLQPTDNSVLYDTSLFSPTVLADEIVDDSEIGDLHLSHQCYILKQLRVAITLENDLVRDEITSRLLNQVWTGSGAITGLDVTISLPDVQMLMSTVESLGGVFNQESRGNSEENHQSSNQEEDDNSDQQIADGALVAIQDVDQHMYMTVEGSINNYSLVGATHYSLVGEKALFRVKYLKQKRWKSSTTWFSLISLYAKSNSGEPLELNYRTGSGFVDISQGRNGGQALWKMVPCNLERFEDDSETKSYRLLSRGTFYLVNQKIDRGISFVDGAPEFVSKLGNPFKWKIFHNFSIARDIVCQNNSSVEVPSNLKPNDAVNDERNCGEIGSLPCIDIKIDKAVLTIAQELPDTRETFPLLQASISAIEFIVQILLAKARVITTSSFALCYFDAQSNLWREYIHPAEVRIFCRYGFYGSEVGHHRVPIHFYARIKEIGISITELSLDILLFVVGQLNLAGPYAIKTSTILGNCCKVENLSGLTLLCHFHGNQEASVAGKQSATFVLRHSAMANHPSESSSVSIQLADGRSYMTSPIHLALAEARSLAWRTRIVSPQDSKTYPGPFLVVDISRRSEDGLSVLVSPLLRIHNESKFSIELRFRRPQQDAAQCATVMLKAGDTIDDSVAAFDARKLSGESKKALLSLGLGNILLSFRPDISEDLTRPKKPVSPRWSDDLSGGKAVPISGVFDKLSYKVRKALLVEPMRYSFSITNCSLTYEDGQRADMHFLIQSIVRDVPVIQPGRDSPVALQEQKEIFILPTIRVLNLLQMEILVVLSDTDSFDTSRSGSIGNQATIPCGSTTDFYADPATIYFVVTLTEFESSSKPLNSGDWVKKLRKQKNDIPFLDIDLDFGGGKYFSSLRLSRGYRGTLEVAIFTSYTVKNGTDVPLFCSAPNQKPLSRNEIEKYSFMIPPELGCYLPPMSTVSWFMKSNKARLNLLEEKSFEAMLDFDALSGLTEISLESEEGPGIKYTTKFGVSLGPFTSKSNVSAQMISVVPRYIVFNKSEAAVLVRQCNLEDEVDKIIAITSKQKIALKLQVGARKREMNVFDRILRKHKNAQDDSLIYIQFQPNVGGYGWSGPMCVASLGRFFLKFRKSSNVPVEQSHHTTAPRSPSPEYAAVQVVEENSSLVMYFHKPPNISLPYRIENNLRQAFITYYQKESSDTENLGSGSSVDYVWDDLTLPRRLVVKIHGLNLLREINLDKVRAWKPFHRLSQLGGLGLRFDSTNRSAGDQRGTNFDESTGIQTVNVGYEVYADGPTRVLRFCELCDSRRQERFHSSKKIRLRLSSFALNLLEDVKQEADPTEVSLYKQILVARSGNICLDSVLTSMQKYNQIRMQSFSVEPKWVGSPFAAMLRKHQSDSSDTSDVLHLTLVLLSSSSNVRQVKYASVVIQPLDLNLDEETLMKVVPFWRVSLSDTKSQSQQYYFDHFEIHPIKIIASFLPGDSYSSYSSAQEMMRSLLHSVIKIPAIKSTTVELNGVLVTHALITIKELCIKCAQHYSWYATRAIYIAKGSPLLPPAFASIFDDLASSSLDVFFDPSSALTNLPGLTIGTFKLVRKCIDGKGFSGTKRYLGDLGKTVKTAGSNVLFAAVTEVSDSVLRGAEASGVNGMVSGFHQGIMKLAMEPSLLGAAFIEGGPDRKIVLDKSPGVDELYIEGYLQAMLDTIYKQEYLRVRVVENQVILKNLPPNSSLIEEVMDRVKGFLISKALLKGDPSTTSQPLRHLRGDNEWKIGPTVQTLCQHLFVSFAIRWLRRQTGNFISSTKWKEKFVRDDEQKKKGIVVPGGQKMKFGWKWGIGKFLLSGLFAYIDGRLCRAIPQPVVRRIVSGFILSFLDKND